MRRLREWEAFYKWGTNQLQLRRSMLRKLTMYWIYQKDSFTNLQREVYKFHPRANLFKYKWPIAWMGIITGCTASIIYNKIFYEDFQIREVGSVQYDEIPFIWSFYRLFVWNFYKLVHGDPLTQKIDDGVARSHARLNQFTYYMKHKNRQFDFMYIGELEHFQFDV